MIRNYLENIVARILDKLLMEGADICHCRRCRDDIIAWVLNHTASCYMTSEAGERFFAGESLKKDFLDDLIKKIYKAKSIIEQSPRHKLSTKLTLPEEEVFKKLLDKLYRERHVDFRDYRNRCIHRRINVRMRAVGVNSYAEYLEVLGKDESEYDRLLDALTINVTEFFRNPEVFRVFSRMVLPEVVAAKARQRHPTLRIWSAGCSSGQEPYTIAMITREYLDEIKQPMKVRIYATDIDEDCLKRTKTAVYAPALVREVSRDLLERYFVYDGENYHIRNELKSIVTVMKHDLVMSKPLGSIDVIFCRNVLIYFEKKLQEKIFNNFYQALNKQGFMIIGKVETLIGVSNLFTIIDTRERIYQKNIVPDDPAELSPPAD